MTLVYLAYSITIFLIGSMVLILWLCVETFLAIRRLQKKQRNLEDEDLKRNTDKQG